MKSQPTTLSQRAPAATIGSCRQDEPASGGPQSHSGHRIRVLLADDHPVVRRGISSCLERHPNVEVVGEAADGQEALCKARELSPDVLLTDVDMPHQTGLAVTETLRKERPNIKVLILSTNNNTEFVMRCAQAGANGYVLKQGSPDDFVAAIETVSSGKPFFSSEVARLAINRMVRGSGSGPDLAELSNREREVLVHIAEGLCNKEIAQRLDIGTRTVETHRQRLMTKLRIHSIAGLTRFAVARGLISMPELATA